MKIFGAIVIGVIALALIFSEGLMAVAMADGDAWASKMVDEIVQNQTGVSAPSSRPPHTMHADRNC